MEHSTQCMGGKMLLLGIILVLVRIFTSWDIWIVIGVLLIIKALIVLLLPMCACQKKAQKK